MKMDNKRSGSQMHGNKAGYQSNGGSVDVTQGGLGCGMSKAAYSKAPMYCTYGKVEKMVHGHMKVGEKI